MDRIGRYQLVRELGRGAMGVVYLANDPNIGRPVAIKTIRLGEVEKPEERDRLRERLFREARSAGMLSHPGIVTIYDVDQQGELAFIAMEYVDGPTLDQVLSRETPIPPEQMFSVLSQAAVALDYAHQKGIVHRDIKPANIMIAADGATKVTDFGVAKIATNEHLTRTGTIVGTPHYMSPEQVQGMAVDGRSDQFSLAVIAYEILTGEKPYTGEQLTTVVYKIVAEEPAPPHRLNPTLGASIESALRKALAKKPEARYATCQEFTETLEKACATTAGWKTMLRGGSLTEPTAVEAAAPAVTLPPSRRTRASETAFEREPGSRVGFWAFLMAILVAAGLLALLGWQAGPWAGKNPSAPNQPKPTAQATPAPAPSSTPAASDKPSPMPPAPPPAAAPPPGPPETQAETQPGTPAQTPAPVAAAAPSSSQAQALPLKPDSSEIPRPPAAKPVSAAAPPPTVRYPVLVISSPGGATVSLDGRPETECKAPCSVQAAPGHHMIAILMPGYQIEHRDVEVGTGGMELPPVILRAFGSTLLLTTDPPGASITVDGRKLPQLTPAQLTLTPGVHTISVEKDGKKTTGPVVVRSGALNYMKLVLGE